MYILIGVLIFICCLFFFIRFFMRKRIIRKIRCMEFCEKLTLFNDLINPFGFCYLPAQDAISSNVDAWQKQFGYCALFDRTACHFNMVFDCEPIYFNYRNCTWMIELWKGQYGINIGSEIGIYRADSLLSPHEYENAVFHGVPEDEMLSMTMELNFKGRRLFSISNTHWWLTGFCMGRFCQPEDLSMTVSITFPDEDMMNCFVSSLYRRGYSKCELCICCQTVTFTCCIPHARQPRFCCRLRAAFSQWQNRLNCRLYRWITRPFTCTMDQILYLYYFLPSAFRHMLLFKRNRRQKLHRRRRRCR